jgi:ATP-dependent DNA helicase RecG
MRQAFNRLERVLELEMNQGYKDKAVVGGIRQFATFWVGQARDEAAGESELALIEQIAESLTEYSRLPGPEARKATLVDIMARIRALPPPVPVAERVLEKPVTKPAKLPVPNETVTPLAIKAPPEISVVEPDPEGLLQPVTILRGVGMKTASQLSKLGAENIGQLLRIYPRRYDDYTLMKPINRLEYGETVTIIGTVWETQSRRTRNVQLIQSTISDGTGTIQSTWFNQPWLVNNLKAGMQIVLSGKVDQYLGRLVLENPEWEPLQFEPLKTRRIVPIYPLTKGLAAHKMRETMKRASNQWAPRIPDHLPDDLRKNIKLYPLALALQQIHFPETQEALHQARRRLIFDELFLLQLGMLSYRNKWQSTPGIPVPLDSIALTNFIEGLPFELTLAQQRIIADLATDMAKQIPMNRLLQGDVGSGKTVIAAAAVVLTVSAGLQAALMAPTEILAGQHYRSLHEMLEFMSIEPQLLTGSTPSAEKERIYADLASGSAKLVIGTHALIQESVRFKELGLAIVDEQHRFGVDQRKSLRDKGPISTKDSQASNPHLLVMSATPIPRTLSLSLYGDLDISILDEMPPGRRVITTRWLRPSERERAYSFVRTQIEKGRQTYIICPLVAESEKTEAKAAVAEYERLKAHIFPDLKLDLLHGRMSSTEKDAVMRSFKDGDTQILIATSVIEVGIDVPNATIMLIEGAERFGLAQLHQFRGRVGRGEHQSYCLLLAGDVSADAEERLTALEQTNDGFLLAERDLELRGPGEFFGRRQSGLPELNLASLMDMEMLVLARTEAQRLMESDPKLEKEQHKLLYQQIERFWEQAGDIS